MGTLWTFLSSASSLGYLPFFTIWTHKSSSQGCRWPFVFWVGAEPGSLLPVPCPSGCKRGVLLWHTLTEAHGALCCVLELPF